MTKFLQNHHKKINIKMLRFNYNVVNLANGKSKIAINQQIQIIY